MTRSLSDSQPAVVGVSFEGARILFSLVSQSSRQDLQWIRNRYEERAQGFKEVLRFLNSCEVLIDKEDSIHEGRNFKNASKLLKRSIKGFNKALVEFAIEANSPECQEIKSFLAEGCVIDGMLQVKPLSRNDTRSAARNVLIEGGIVSLDHLTGSCRFSAHDYGLVTRAKFGQGISPQTLQTKTKRQLDLGTEAELSVVQYERKKLGSRFAQQVVHIAAHNVSAGFDVASIRVSEGTISEERLIEVKAVSPNDFGFFLTQNEYEVAERYSERYYLYLVPIERRKPVIRKLRVIRDPIENILTNHASWNVTHNAVHCTLRSRTIRESPKSASLTRLIQFRRAP